MGQHPLTNSLSPRPGRDVVLGPWTGGCKEAPCAVPGELGEEDAWPPIARPAFLAPQDRRRATRTSLPVLSRWRGVAKGSVGFAFCVHDFCATGLSIVARSIEPILAIGQVFHARLQVPDVAGQVLVRLQVRRIEIGDTLLGPQASYGLYLEPATDHARCQWSRALLLHGQAAGPLVTPVTLAREGFEVAAPARALHFTTASSTEDFAAVRQLRWQCYREAGLLQPQHRSPADMSDDYDARSQVIVAWHHRRPVATFRVFAPTPQDAFSFDQYMGQRPGLPAKLDAVEFARLAVHADFRGHDMLPTLCQLMARYALQRGRRYAVFATNNRLAAYYARYGATDTGLTFTYCGHPAKVLQVDFVALWQSGTPLARHAMFGAPPPLDDAFVPMPRWRRALMPQGAQGRPAGA